MEISASGWLYVMKEKNVMKGTKEVRESVTKGNASEETTVPRDWFLVLESIYLVLESIIRGTSIIG